MNKSLSKSWFKSTTLCRTEYGLDWNGMTIVSNGWMDQTINMRIGTKNAVKNGNNKCVQMSSSNFGLGKWTDDDCARKYLVVCPKRQSSKTVMLQQIYNLTKNCWTLVTRGHTNWFPIHTITSTAITSKFMAITAMDWRHTTIFP